MTSGECQIHQHITIKLKKVQQEAIQQKQAIQEQIQVIYLQD